MEEQNYVPVTDIAKIFLSECFAFIMLVVVESVAILLLWNNVVATVAPIIPVINIWHAIAANVIIHMPVLTKTFY